MECNIEQNILVVEHLKEYFPIKKQLGMPRKYVKAVDDVSFSIETGKALGLVGESGCGKTTLIRALLQLIKPTEGSVYFEGNNLSTMRFSQLKTARRNMQIVFQDPYASLHPKMRVGTILEEPLIINGFTDRAQRKRMVLEILEQVGLQTDQLKRYPHEFSGGQRQRIVIARALILKPKLVILDEPVSALDVSIRSQILNLLEQLQKDLGLTYLFISHDLSVVEHLCDSVMVMYLGHVLETGTREQIFSNPLSPYTKALLSAIPSVKPAQRTGRIILQGEIPSPVDPPQGCVFKTRCPYCREDCDRAPSFFDAGDGHQVACHRVGV